MNLFFLFFVCTSSLRFNEIPDIEMNELDLAGRRRRRRKSDDSGGSLSPNVEYILGAPFKVGVSAVSTTALHITAFTDKVGETLKDSVFGALTGSVDAIADNAETLVTVKARLLTTLTFKYSFGKHIVSFPKEGWALKAGKSKTAVEWNALFLTVKFVTAAKTALKLITGGALENYCCSAVTSAIRKAGASMKIEAAFQMRVSRINPVAADLSAPGDRAILPRPRLAPRKQTEDNVFANVLTSTVTYGLSKAFKIDPKFVARVNIVLMVQYVLITVPIRLLGFMSGSNPNARNANSEVEKFYRKLAAIPRLIGLAESKITSVLKMPKTGFLNYNPAITAGTHVANQKPGWTLVVQWFGGNMGDNQIVCVANDGSCSDANEPLKMELSIKVILPAATDTHTAAETTPWEKLQAFMGGIDAGEDAGDDATKQKARADWVDEIGSALKAEPFQPSLAECGAINEKQMTAAECAKTIVTFTTTQPTALADNSYNSDAKKAPIWVLADSGAAFKGSTNAPGNQFTENTRGDLIRVTYTLQMNDNAMANVEDKMGTCLDVQATTSTTFAEAVRLPMFETTALTEFGVSILEIKTEERAASSVEDTDSID